MQVCATIANYLKIFLLINAEWENKIYYGHAGRHSLSVGHFTGVKMEARGPWTRTSSTFYRSDYYLHWKISRFRMILKYILECLLYYSWKIIFLNRKMQQSAWCFLVNYFFFVKLLIFLRNLEQFANLRYVLIEVRKSFRVSHRLLQSFTKRKEFFVFFVQN